MRTANDHEPTEDVDQEAYEVPVVRVDTNGYEIPADSAEPEAEYAEPR